MSLQQVIDSETSQEEFLILFQIMAPVLCRFVLGKLEDNG